MPRFDLQSHSTRSDGSLEPAAVVHRAAAAGVEILALSDHDTVDGVAEALEAGRTAGIRVVPACEISALDGDVEDLHVLGYGLDHEDPALLATLASWREDRALRAERMAAALEAEGFTLDRTDLDARRAAGLPIGRPHLAQAAFAAAPAGRFADFGELLVAYLTPGAPAYVRRERPTVDEAIATIHAAGGVAVWAHPFWDLDDPDAVVATLERFAEAGLDGVEAFYVTHTREQTVLLDATARRLDLLTTGSADFHGPDHPHFSRFCAFELHGLEPRLGPIGASA